jgi:hypothetical protein
MTRGKPITKEMRRLLVENVNNDRQNDVNIQHWLFFGRHFHADNTWNPDPPADGTLNTEYLTTLCRLIRKLKNKANRGNNDARTTLLNYIEKGNVIGLRTAAAEMG